MKKRLLSLILAIVLALTMLPVAVSAAGQYSDITGHWAQQQIETWSERGILQGSEGRFRPNAPITRAEMAVILDRVMKYQVTATNTFSDIPEGTWFADAILRANAAGVLFGSDGRARPEDTITRQEAAVMLCRALNIDGTEGSTSFSDNDNIASWALPQVKALQEKGLISGVGGNMFDPTNSITRAAVVTMLNNSIQKLYQLAGEYSENASGTVVINAPDVKLKNMSISGNLIIAAGVGEGNVTLDNVTISGDTIINGGGKNSLYFNNVTVGGALIVSKVGNDVRVVATGSTSASVAVLESGAILVTKELVGGGIESVTIPESIAAGSNIVLDGSFEKVTNEGADVKIEATGSIKNLELKASTTVTGDVDIITYTTAPGADSTIKGEEVEGGKTNEPLPVEPTPQYGGGGGGGGQQVQTFTVTFNSNGGSAVAAITNVSVGAKITAPTAPTKTEDSNSLTFLGWYKEAALTNAWDFTTDTVTSNITLYAKWSGWQAPVATDDRFAEGYPKATTESGKIVLKLKMADVSEKEIFMVVNQINATAATPSAADVQHGHAISHEKYIVYCDKAPYLKVADMDEHIINTGVSITAQRGAKIYFVVKDATKTTPNPVVLEYAAGAAAQAVDSTPPGSVAAYVNSTNTKLYLYFDEILNAASIPVSGCFRVGNELSSGVIPTSVAIEDCSSKSPRGSRVILTFDTAFSYTENTTKVFYIKPSANPLCDTATTPNNVDDFLQIITKVDMTENTDSIVASADGRYIFFETNATPLEFNWIISLKYATSTVDRATGTISHECDKSYSTNGHGASFSLYVAEPPALEAGGKYYITLSVEDGSVDYAGEITTGIGEIEVVPGTKDSSININSVSYNTTVKSISIVFEGETNGRNCPCCFFKVTKGTVTYNLRGFCYKGTGNTMTIPAECLAHIPDEFWTAGVTISYDPAGAGHDRSASEGICYPSGKPFTFSDIAVTIVP